MTTKLAVGLAAVLAALILVPVLAVVALGAYGSSLGGRVGATGSGDAELEIFPSHGVPGSMLRITGKHWPPRSGVTIWLERQPPNAKSESRSLRLAEIVASRRGSFELSTIIPRSILPFGTATVRIKAAGRESDAGFDAARYAPFKVDPYPNEVILSVVDAGSRLPSEGAMIRIEDAFGQKIAVNSTGATGEVSFVGIRPGKKLVTVRKVDYKIARAAIDVPETGQAAVQIVLDKSPGKRLLFFAHGSLEDGETLWVGLDRASGLPVRERITVPTGKVAPSSVPDSNPYQSFFLSIDHAYPSFTAGAGDINALWAMGAVGRELRYTSSGNSTAIWHRYLGRSIFGDVVFSRWSAVLPAESSYLGIIDPHSGQIVLRERLHRNILPPILSSDGSRVFLVNGGARSVRVLEIQTGEKTTIVENLPWPVAKVIGDPSDDSYLILAAIDGSVHKLHTPTGTITEIYVGGRLQSVVTVMGDGRLITSGFRSRELVVSNPNTGQIQQIIPLQSKIDWILVDDTGPFIFAVTLAWHGVSTVQVIDTKTFTVVDVVEMPRLDELSE